jgi:hypothetical protein
MLSYLDAKSNAAFRRSIEMDRYKSITSNAINEYWLLPAT